jgi:hypothetical protein
MGMIALYLVLIFFCGFWAASATGAALGLATSIAALCALLVIRDGDLPIRRKLSKALDKMRAELDDAVAEARANQCLTCKRQFTELNPDHGGQVCIDCWSRSH